MKRSSESVKLTLIGAALSLPGCAGKAPPQACQEPPATASEWGGGAEDRQDDKLPGQACYNSQYHASGRATPSHRSFVPVYLGARAAGYGSSTYRPPAPAPKPPTTSSIPSRSGGFTSSPGVGGTARGGFGGMGRAAGAAS